MREDSEQPYSLSLVHHHYGIFGLASQMSFCRETSAGVAKCQLFSQAKARKDMTQPLLYKVQSDRSPQHHKNSYHRSSFYLLSLQLPLVFYQQQNFHFPTCVSLLPVWPMNKKQFQKIAESCDIIIY